MQYSTIIRNKKNYSLSWDNIFILLILSFPICDILTGIFIFKIGLPESFIGSPSQLIRIIFINFGLLTIQPQKQKICIATLLWILLIESTTFFYVKSFSPFLSGLNYAIKLLYIIIFYFKAEEYCKSSYNKLLKFQSTIFDIAIIYALGIIIPSILGFGVASYSEGTFGQKGLLSSGNAIGIFLGVMNCLLILKRNKSIPDYISALTLSTSLIYLATKTALSLFIIGLLILFFKQRKTLRLIILIPIIGLIIINANTIIEMIYTVADVIIFRFENKDSLFSFLMSSRDIYISNAISEFLNSPIWILKFIIGGGAFMSFRSSFTDGMIFDTLENELFDIFFMYGLIGLTIYVNVIIYFSAYIFKRSRVLGIIFLLFCLHSIFAGHILFDGIPVIAAVLIIQMAKYIKVERKLFKV